MKKLFHTFKIKLAGLLLLLKIPGNVAAQHPEAFANEINFYKQWDAINPVPSDPVLFIGSSSIKNWYQFDTTFKNLNCINRGFGGSCIDDVVFYADDVLLKYNPRQIILYVGENDFALSPAPEPEAVFQKFQGLYQLIRTYYPQTPVIYIGIKPSPAKHDRLHKILHYNFLVKEFLQTEQNTTFIDMYSSMLDATGKPNAMYFNEDFTHLNPKGYELWDSYILPLIIPMSEAQKK